MIHADFTTEKPILFSEESFAGKSIGVVELNRTKILNALDTECYNLLESKLHRWAENSLIAAIVIHSRNDRAFCAGGDVKKLVLMTREKGLGYAKEFFTQEYYIDHLIHQFQKPVVVFADGITMGAGVGLMNGASHRIVTERTLLAMPEQGIGLFPDVGATYFLRRLPNHFGLFMGLTGARITGADAVKAGLADFYMTSSMKRRVLSDLLKLPLESNPQKDQELISLYLSKALPPAPPAHNLMAYENEIWPMWQQAGLNTQNAKITKSHNDQSVDTLRNKISRADQFQAKYTDLTIAIEKYNGRSDFLIDAKDRFQKGSPTSKRLFYEAYFRHQNKNITEVFVSEWEMAIRCSKEREFDEGVRALLIDKDSNPKWLPEQDVRNLERFFQSGEANDLAHKLTQKGFQV